MPKIWLGKDATLIQQRGCEVFIFTSLFTTPKAWSTQKSLHVKNTPTLQSSLALHLAAALPKQLSWQGRHWPKLSLTSSPKTLCTYCTMHAVIAKSVRLIITGKKVWHILTWCTFLSTEIATGSDCGLGTQALLQEFIKLLILQPSLTSWSLACCTAEDQYDLTAAACSFET